MKARGSGWHVLRISRLLFHGVKRFSKFIRGGGARAAGVLGLGSLAVAIFSAGQVIVLSRVLGPEAYGIMTLTIALPVTIYALVDARSVGVTIRYLSMYKEAGRSQEAKATIGLGYAVDLAVATATLATVLTVAKGFARRWDLPADAVLGSYIYSASLLFQALGPTSLAFLAVAGRFKTRAYCESGTALFRFAVSAMMVSIVPHPFAAVIAAALGNVAAGLLPAAVVIPLLKRDFGSLQWIRPDRVLRKDIKEIGQFLLLSNVNELLGVVGKHFDVLALGYFGDSSQVGQYKLARSLSGMVGIGVVPLQTVSYPKFVQLSVRDDGKLREALRRALIMAGVPLALVVIVFALFAEPVIVFVAGRQYEAAGHIASILLLGTAVWLAFFWLKPAFLAKGMIRAWTGISVVSVVFLIIGYVLLGFWWGAVGIALTIAGTNVVGHLLGWLYLERSRK